MRFLQVQYLLFLQFLFSLRFLFNQAFKDVSGSGAGANIAKRQRDSLLKANLKAETEVTVLRRKNYADAEKAIYEDETQSYGRRMLHLQSFLKDQSIIIEENRKADIEKLRIQYAGQYTDEEDFQLKAKALITNINLVAQGAQAEITRNGEEARLDIVKDYADMRIKEIEKSMNEETAIIINGENEKLMELAKANSNGEITVTDYNNTGQRGIHAAQSV